MTYHRIINKSNISGATSDAGTAYPMVHLNFQSPFFCECVAQSLVFCFVCCQSLFVSPPFLRLYDLFIDLHLWYLKTFLTPVYLFRDIY